MIDILVVIVGVKYYYVYTYFVEQCAQSTKQKQKGVPQISAPGLEQNLSQ